MSGVYLDGEEALLALLDGINITDPPLQVNGVDVPAARTYFELPADLYDQVRTDLHVALLVYRAGWADDENRTEGHDRITVEVYGPTGDVARAYAKAIEEVLVDNFHDCGDVGFIDDVRVDVRRHVVPVPTDIYTKVSATYRLISRPD